MRVAESNDEHPVALAGVRLMLLTGFRISEVQGMKRDWLHADQGYVHFPDTESDGQVRAIGRRAADLSAKPAGAQELPLVFPSDIGDGHFTATKSCLARLCASANIEGVTPHTLRHTFGSVASDLGFSELTIAALLGHAVRSVTQGGQIADTLLNHLGPRTIVLADKAYDADRIRELIQTRVPRPISRQRATGAGSPASANGFTASAT